MGQTDVGYKWGFEDQFGLRGYAGMQFKSDTAPTMASTAAFTAIIAGMSECGIVRVEANSIDTTEASPVGDNASNYVATVIFKESDGDYKCPITIPGGLS